MWIVPLGRLPLRWDNQGDVFGHQLISRIRPSDVTVGGGADLSVFDTVDYTASDTRLRSTLRVTRTADGAIACAIHGDDDHADDDQVAPWRTAVNAAATATAASRTATWNALIGPQPQPVGALLLGVDLRPVALAAETVIGPVRLIPGDVCMHEMVATSALHQPRYPVSSWPLIVEGVTASYAEPQNLPVSWWPMDRQHAVQTTNRVAALLSLAWGGQWAIRAEPVRVAPGERVTVPHLAGDHTTGNWATGCPIADDQLGHPRQRRDLPDWVSAAWLLIDHDPVLRHALSAYYEAVRLDAEHPSAAALFYITVIEGIGTPLAGGLGGLPSARASFRAGLATVMPAVEVAALTAWAYELRSRTAHVGALHGAEHTLGYLRDSDYTFDDSEVFEEDQLTAIHQAAHDVLTNAFSAAAAPANNRQ